VTAPASHVAAAAAAAVAAAVFAAVAVKAAKAVKTVTAVKAVEVRAPKFVPLAEARQVRNAAGLPLAYQNPAHVP